MAEQQNDWQAQDRHELHDPSNPPNVLLREESRNRALMSYLLPIIILFVIIGLGLIYWSTRSGVNDTRDDSTIGTTGERTPGGSDPRPGFSNTQDELDFRGAPPSDREEPPTEP
jgi:hypothetical protein